MYKGFTIDNKIPGPTIIVNEGDIVEFTIVNDGILPHGASIHAAYTQTSKYLGKIMPKDSTKVVFKANMPVGRMPLTDRESLCIPLLTASFSVMLKNR